jgi:hypothetical protein
LLLSFAGSIVMLEEDSPKVYLREIGRHKLLNGREEYRIGAGDPSQFEVARRKLVRGTKRAERLIVAA